MRDGRRRRTPSLPTVPHGPDDLHERIAGGWPVSWRMLNELINEDARKHGLETYLCAPNLFSENGLVFKVKARDGLDSLYYPAVRDSAALAKFARDYHENQCAKDARERLGGNNPKPRRFA